MPLTRQAFHAMSARPIGGQARRRRLSMRQAGKILSEKRTTRMAPDKGTLPKGIAIRGELQNERWGTTVMLGLPGGVEVMLYEPRHPLAIST